MWLVKMTLPNSKHGWACAKVSSLEESIKVEFFVGLSAPNKLQRQPALRRVANFISTEGIRWIRPSGQDWTIDLEGLKSICSELGDVQWLHGEYSFVPEYESEEISYLEWNISVALYIHRDAVEEAAASAGKQGSTLMSGLPADFRIPEGYEFLVPEYEKFFSKNPDYGRNVFIMTRFGGDDLLRKLDGVLRTVLQSHGLKPLRADDFMYMADRNPWNNVCVYMICCKYGIAVLEDRIADEFNPNVALEYGFMRALNKRALLLADKGFRNIRADIIGTWRETFDITNIKRSIKRPIETWLKELDL